jgi:hypothetical protein
MSEEQPAGASTKRIVLIVVLAVGLPMLSLICCCGGCSIWGLMSFKEIPAAQASALQFLQGISGDQLEATYQNTTANFKSVRSLAQFRTFVARYPALSPGASFVLGNTNITTLPQGSRATIAATVSDKANPGDITCTITLVKENGAWKVDGFTVP